MTGSDSLEVAVINPRNLFRLPTRALIHHLWGSTRRQLERMLPPLLALPRRQGLPSLWRKGNGTERYDRSPAVTAHSSVNQVEVLLILVFVSKPGGTMQWQGSEQSEEVWLHLLGEGRADLWRWGRPGSPRPQVLRLPPCDSPDLA